jgi:hypothetical protein
MFGIKTRGWNAVPSRMGELLARVAEAEDRDDGSAFRVDDGQPKRYGSLIERNEAITSDLVKKANSELDRLSDEIERTKLNFKEAIELLQRNFYDDISRLNETKRQTQKIADVFARANAELKADDGSGIELNDFLLPDLIEGLSQAADEITVGHKDITRTITIHEGS